jgi:hypothetical protein
MPYAYETDGAAIYAESFATIRAEADLARFDPDEERVTVRMIHAAGLVGLEAHVRFTPGMVAAARAALQAGRADPLRRAHGERRHHPQAPAGRQPVSSARCTTPRSRPSPRAWAPRARPRRWSCGGRIWRRRRGHRQRAHRAVPPA